MTLNANTGLRLGNIGTGHMCVLTPTQQPSRSFGTDLFFAGHRLWVRRQKSLTMYILVNLWFSWCFTIIQVPGSSFCPVVLTAVTVNRRGAQWCNIRSCDTESPSESRNNNNRRRRLSDVGSSAAHLSDWGNIRPITSCYIPPAMIAQQRTTADVTWVGAGGSRPRACAVTMSLSVVSHTVRVVLATRSSYGVVIAVFLLGQTLCGCHGGQFDG